MNENTKEWSTTLDSLQQAIDANPIDLHAYLSVDYLLMNLLVEEDYEDHMQVYYAGLLKKYFLESYCKFSSNKEYLFYTGITAHMSEWFFEIDIGEAKEMIESAFLFEPSNKIYQWGYYTYIDTESEINIEKSLTLSHEILKDVITIKNLVSMGALGAYLLDIMMHKSRN